MTPAPHPDRVRLLVTVNTEHPDTPGDPRWRQKAESAFGHHRLTYSWENSGVTCWFDADGRAPPLAKLVPARVNRVLNAGHLTKEHLHCLELRITSPSDRALPRYRDPNGSSVMVPDTGGFLHGARTSVMYWKDGDMVILTAYFLTWPLGLDPQLAAFVAAGDALLTRMTEYRRLFPLIRHDPELLAETGRVYGEATAQGVLLPWTRSLVQAASQTKQRPAA